MTDMKPPYRLKEWRTGRTLEPVEGFGTPQEALSVAAAMTHDGELFDDGPFYIPRAYVVDSAGGYVGAPVFLQVPNDDKEQEA